MDAEVVCCRSEKHGSEVSGEDFVDVEVGSRAFEEFEFVADLVVGDFVDRVFHGFIIDAGDVHGRAERTVRSALEEVDDFIFPVVNALEAGTIAEWPVDGKGVDTEDVFEFVEQVKGRPRGAVELVHEGEDWDAAAAADFEEFAGLGFDALTGVDDHDGGIDGGEDSVGVLGEVFVTGCVEDVDDAVLVFELEDRRGNRDTALFFELHPVGGGGALVFLGGDRAGEVEGAAVEEEFLSEGGFSRVRVGNDGE